MPMYRYTLPDCVQLNCRGVFAIVAFLQITPRLPSCSLSLEAVEIRLDWKGSSSHLELERGFLHLGIWRVWARTGQGLCGVPGLDTEFAYNNSYQASIKMAPFETLYRRKCRSPLHWSEVGERLALGPDVLQEVEDKVRIAQERLLTAQSRQRSYADRRRRDLEFQIGDHVFLKVSPTKGIRRFGIRGSVAYRLGLPPNLSGVHNVFHVSVLRKYIFDPAHVLNATPLELRDDLNFEKQPVRILAREVKKLRNRDIPYLKVLWSNHDE
uniref:Tf2-1-like SH3-like domain-containing protein n=1 Tax=Ananas comosus var. bracteatus TaxID=296719 RepID=A0A6V7NJ63_ANACO|nr:unnamed protein product [Ananas comosus var. bracteatus]